MIPKNLWT